MKSLLRASFQKIKAARTLWPFLGVLAVALAARLFRLDWPGMWGDEGFSIFLARSSLADLVTGTANDLHPPFYYLLLKIWLLPGWSIVYARLLSVLCGVLTVALAFWIGCRLFGRAVGAWAALFLALSPMHILLSREVRMYVPLVLLGSLSAYLTWRWLQRPFCGVRLAYIAATLLALYTQNMAFFLLLFENALAFLVALSTRRWKDLGHWVLGQVLLLVGYLPWLPVALYQFHTFHPTWMGRAVPSQARGLLVHLALGQPAWSEQGAWEGVALAWPALLLLMAVGWPVAGGRRWPGVFVGLWFLLPGAALFALALSFPFYQEKQFLLLTVPLALLLGVGVSRLRPCGQVAVVLLFLLLVGPSLYNLYFQHRLPDHPVEEAWREAAAYIDAHRQAGDGLVVNPGAAEVILDLYLETPLPCEGYPLRYTPQVGGYVGQTATPERVAARLGPFVERYRRIWLVECCLPTFWDPGRAIPAWLEDWGRPVALPEFPGLEMRLYENRGVSPEP